MTMKSRRFLLSVAALATAPLFGDAATNTVAELEPVVVTASPIAKEERFTPDGAETTFVGMDQTAFRRSEASSATRCWT